ncbi:MarR family winged helix-turn-helix transcriptional regulator [Nakamurella sp. GG22]
MKDASETGDVGPRIAEIYSVVGPLYRRAFRTVEAAQHIEGASVGVRAVLEVLFARGPMTVPQIGRGLTLSRQFVQRMVNDALDRSWVRTLPNPAHQRSSLIQLTTDGQRTIEAIVQREHAVLAQLSGDLTDDDVDTTLRVLRKMLEQLEPVDGE